MQLFIFVFTRGHLVKLILPCSRLWRKGTFHFAHRNRPSFNGPKLHGRHVESRGIETFILPHRNSFPNIREVKIARFRVRLRVGLPVPVLGYTENQSNLRYTG